MHSSHVSTTKWHESTATTTKLSNESQHAIKSDDGQHESSIATFVHAKYAIYAAAGHEWNANHSTDDFQSSGQQSKCSRLSAEISLLKELEKMQIKIPYLFSIRNARGAKGFHGSTHM